MDADAACLDKCSNTMTVVELSAVRTCPAGCVQHHSRHTCRMGASAQDQQHSHD